MEQQRVHGLVVREIMHGENDKLLVVLTKETGRLLVCAKGARSIKNRHFAAVQLFSYSEFVLRARGEYLYVSDSTLLEAFFPIRRDLDKLAAATYFCDVAAELGVEGEENDPLVSLTLNCLYALANLDYPIKKVKGAFELRCAVVEGLCPDLSACGRCGVTENAPFYLDVMNGRLLCGDCRRYVLHTPGMLDEGVSVIHIPVSPAVLDAMRFTVSASEKRFLSFRLDPKELPAYASVCEKYLLNQLGHGFGSLEYYKSILE